MSRPNILLIVADSFRADALGPGNPFRAQTPNLNRLGAHSTRFTTAIAQSSHTGGSVPSMMTSGYNLTDGPEGRLPEDRHCLAEVLAEAGYATGAFHSNPLISRPYGFGRGFARFYDSLRVSSRLGVWLRRLLIGLSSRPYVSGSRMVRMVSRWIGEAGRPFFLWAQFMDTHGPYLPHGGVKVSRWHASRLWKRSVLHPESVSARNRELLRRLYREEVEYFDRCVGRLIANLDRLGLREDTVLAVTADHGEQFCEHGHYNHPRQLYEEQIHVPLLINRPGREGAVAAQQVQLVDLAPTLCRLAGVERPPCWRGHDLFGDLADHEVAFSATTGWWETAGQHIHAARTPERKVILYARNGSVLREEAYHLSEDPSEQVDLAERGQNDGPPWEELRARLLSHMQGAKVTEGGAAEPEPASEAEKSELQRRLKALGYYE
ncbi:MAG: sulfatase [Candidatus Brocadiia bacterium]